MMIFRKNIIAAMLVACLSLLTTAQEIDNSTMVCPMYTPPLMPWLAFKECMRAFPLTDTSIQALNTAQIAKSLKQLYSYGDIVQDGSKVAPELLALQYKDWEPMLEDANVDYETELEAIGATEYESIYEYESAVTQLFARLHDAHTVYSGGFLADFETGAKLVIPLSFDVENVNDTRRITAVPNQASINLPLNPLFNASASEFALFTAKADEGLALASINGVPILDALQNWADKMGGYRDPAVRFNNLLISLRSNPLIDGMLFGMDFPDEFVFEFEDGTLVNLPVAVFAMSDLSGTHSEVISRILKPTEFSGNFWSFLMQYIQSNETFTEGDHEFPDVNTTTSPPPVLPFVPPTATTDVLMERNEILALPNTPSYLKVGFATALKASNHLSHLLFDIEGTPVIKSNSMMGNFEEVYHEAMKMGKENNSKRIVLDVTGNGGGSVYTTAGVLSMLIKEYDAPNKVCGPYLKRATDLILSLEEGFSSNLEDGLVVSMDFEDAANQTVQELGPRSDDEDENIYYRRVVDTTAERVVDVMGTMEKWGFEDADIDKWLLDYHVIAHAFPSLGSADNAYDGSAARVYYGLQDYEELLPEGVEGLSVEERASALIKLYIRGLGALTRNDLNGCEVVSNGFLSLLGMRGALNVDDNTCTTKDQVLGDENFISMARGDDVDSLFFKPWIQPDCNFIFGDQFAAEQYDLLRQQRHEFEEIIVLTDGRCGSACSMLVTGLQQIDLRAPESKVKVTVVSYGGIPGQKMDTSSFRGGFVEGKSKDNLKKLYSRIVQQSLFYQGSESADAAMTNDLLALPLIDSADFGLNFGAEIGSFGTKETQYLTLPLEYMRKPANYHWDNVWYTFSGGSTPENIYTAELWTVYHALAKGEVEQAPTTLLTEADTKIDENFKDGEASGVGSTSPGIASFVLASALALASGALLWV